MIKPISNYEDEDFTFEITIPKNLPIDQVEETCHMECIKTEAGKIQNKRYKARVVGGEVAQDLFKRWLCLPSGTAMTEEDLNRVVGVILNCKKS